jgi:hypothetical protein
MVNQGGPEVEVLEDQWTAVTCDRSLSAHFEHSVAITENGPWILSRLETNAAPELGAGAAGTRTQPAAVAAALGAREARGGARGAEPLVQLNRHA